MVFDVPGFLAAARRCAELLLGSHWRDGRLRRSSRGGTAGISLGVLEDYADLTDGLLILHQATPIPAPESRGAAGTLGLRTVPVDADGRVWERSTRRAGASPWDPTDGATPSGSSALAGALLAYSALTGSAEHRRAAEPLLGTIGWLGRQQPRFLGCLLAVGEAWLDGGPVQVAVSGEAGSGPLTTIAWRHRPPGAVVVSGESDAPGVPLLAYRATRGHGALAYVCRGMVCDAPVGTVDELRAALTA